MGQEGGCILLGPEVDVQGIDLVEVLLLVALVVGGDVPLLMTLYAWRVEGECEQGGLLVGVREA